MNARELMKLVTEYGELNYSAGIKSSYDIDDSMKSKAKADELWEELYDIIVGNWKLKG